jgi:hypothetical protein
MSREEITELLWSLPADERLAMLCCSVIERDPGATAAVKGLIAVATAMARRLNVEQRFELAEVLRDSADEIERRRQKVPIA